MKKFPIALMGTRKDGKKWALIERETAGSDLVDVAFLTLKASTKLKEGGIIEIPEAKLEGLTWK